ncbi:MAG: hypothetical protein GWN94_11310, partial [Phycisphaerae bacterium]|nr:hypothetical protein [Phycisphaerae bacterium]
LLVYDIKLGSWWIKEGYPIAISSMAIAKRGSTIDWNTTPYSSWDTFDVPGGWDGIGSSEEDQLVLIGASDGYVRNFAAGQDDDGTDVASH